MVNWLSEVHLVEGVETEVSRFLSAASGGRNWRWTGWARFTW